MTLTEFLMARIAEDEASLPTGHDCWYPPERYEVECEAKRAVVELHRGEFPDGLSRCRTCQPEYMPCPTLRALSTIYADHPDYREEWRP